MTDQQKKAGFLDVTSFNYSEFTALAEMDSAERTKAIQAHTKPEWSKSDFLSVTKMSFFEELVASCIFLFAVPGAVFTIPVIVVAVGLYIGDLWTVARLAAVLLGTLAVLPVTFQKQALSSWSALQILRYFSFKAVFAETLQENKPYILVAPPHGVFPFGNIVTMIAFPSLMGYSFRGLAATAAMRMPVFRQVLGTIGAIDASRKSATDALKNNHTIGISTGGVAEVFETNSPTGDEVIVLKSRKGIINMAFRTGAALVPCYLFGNTKLYSLWTGGSLHDVFKKWSRRLGFAMILFWGRFGLPVPYRVPIVGAMGKAIPVPLNPNPTEAEIEAMHEKLIVAMVALFDEHKGAYGWGDKKLIIQ